MNQWSLNQLAIACVAALLVALVSHRLKMLTKSGAVATFLLAVPLFGIGGWKWTIPMVTFFVLSNALSGIGRRKKAMVEDIVQKSNSRDYAQVFANGGVGGILVVLSGFFPSLYLYPVYLASIAAVTADTWSTEIGIASGQTPFLITTMKRVEPGTSGGVSMAGFFAAAAGSAVIAFSGALWVDSLKVVLLAAAAGFAGCLVDSLIGATMQAQYECPACGKHTERLIHCTQSTTRTRGFEWMGNDCVNWICAGAGAFLMMLILAFSDVLELT